MCCLRELVASRLPLPWLPTFPRVGLRQFCGYPDTRATVLGKESLVARTSGTGIPPVAWEQALRGWINHADSDAGRGQPGERTRRSARS